MDVKVSRKETRFQPSGPVEVLVSNIFDLYPIFGSDDRFIYQDQLSRQDREDLENLIVDVEILDDDREELLDRAMFASVKQRGQDPTDPDDGNQWAEAVMGEVSSPMIMTQIQQSVNAEGPGVRVVFNTIKVGEKEYFNYKIELTNAI
jgi:hypothetical protein